MEEEKPGLKCSDKAGGRAHHDFGRGRNRCPRLSRAAYVGKDLVVQLYNQARFGLLDPSYVKVDDVKKIVWLPETFQWYESDFSTSGKAVVLSVN